MKRRIFSIVLSLILMLLVIPAVRAAEIPITVTITGHVAGNLQVEIDTYMSANGITSYSSIEGLTVNGGTLDYNDRSFFYDNGLSQTLKAVDFSKTNIDFRGITGSEYDKADNPNELQSYAFGNWTAMTTIILPDTVTYIKSYAFNNCTSLEKLYLPSGLKNIEHSVFPNSAKLKDVYSSSAVQPDSVHPNAFMNCDKNAVLHLPDGVMDEWDKIDFSTDHKMWQLRIENMPPIITWFDVYRESDTTAEIQVYSDEPGYCYYALVKNDEKAPAVDTSKNGLAFDSDNRLTINLSNLESCAYDIYIRAVDSLGNIGETIKIDIDENVDVVISNHVEGKLLYEIAEIFDSLGIPGEYSKIRRLKVMGAGFNDQDWYDFLDYYLAYKAESIDLSGTAIESIPDDAFGGYNIKEVILPPTLKSIGKSALGECDYLTTVILQSPLPPEICSDTFDDTPNNFTVYIPPKSSEAYKAVEDGNTGDGLWYGFEIKEYSTVVLQDDGNGAASTDTAWGLPGKTVTLSAVPNKGYSFKGWQVISPDSLNISGNSFTLPEGEVILKAIFEKEKTPSDVIDIPKTGDMGEPLTLLMISGAAFLAAVLLLRKKLYSK